MRHMAVKLQDVVVFRGPEQDARQAAFDLILEIRDKHTYKDKAKQAFVTASALAVLNGDMDEFVPDTSAARSRCAHCRAERATWTVSLVPAVATIRRDVAA
jgi:hypothetical protein